jgi:hypothetical protein
MVDDRVVEIPWDGPRFHKLQTFVVVGGSLVNLRPGGALRWKAEDHRLERLGSMIW